MRDMTPRHKRKNTIYTVVILDTANRQIGHEELVAMPRKDAYKKLMRHLKALEDDDTVAGGYLKFERYEG